jgi:polyisoprenoid-binding protein YceI
MKRAVAVLSVLLPLSLALAGCDEKKEAAPPSQEKLPATSAPAASPAAAAPAAAAVPASGVHLAVTKAKGTFLIDAPAEKIKGMSEDAKGELSIDPMDLGKSRGEVSIKMTALATSTFGDKGKDDSQTEHARNWMEVGPESAADKKAKFEFAKLTITGVETATPKLADVKEEGGARTFKAKVMGDLWLHGITSKKTLAVTITVKGPADAPTEVTVKTDEPFAISLKEHEIMPRDKLGSFLNGALEKIGKKIDDKVQVSIEATATKK